MDKKRSTQGENRRIFEC